jgi:hypothetical protein
MAVVPLEGLGKLEYSMTLSGLEPSILRLVDGMKRTVYLTVNVRFRFRKIKQY